MIAWGPQLPQKNLASVEIEKTLQPSFACNHAAFCLFVNCYTHLWDKVPYIGRMGKTWLCPYALPTRWELLCNTMSLNRWPTC